MQIFLPNPVESCQSMALSLVAKMLCKEDQRKELVPSAKQHPGGPSKAVNISWSSCVSFLKKSWGLNGVVSLGNQEV